ncbi:cilia- and flagella-associated protein 57-like [Conger conger]|uniref:cilia- and flagella-associated protein 57-like n=1 Tax=Conger conger TaxID=82655 RepID=UPI002A5AA9D0|nr:cilia- and flagella-associated protein 57-like [Conger conger]
MSVVASAQLHFVFGVQSGVANNLAYFDEQTIIFPSGNNCVFNDIHRKCQRFIPATEKSQGMLAMAISPDRLYLAVSERGEKGTITVYELQQDYIRKRKVLSGEGPFPVFVCMAFSHDSQYLIGQSGGPDWTLFFWIWQKSKLVCTVKTGGPTTPICKVSFNPQNNTQIFVCAHGVFKFFSYAEGALKQTNTKKQESHHYLSHDWVSENEIIMGTDKGQLLLFKYQDLQWKTDLRTTQESERIVEKKKEESTQHLQVTAITSYCNGFVCSAGPGLVYLFQKSNDKDIYRISREIQIPFDPYRNDCIQAEKQEIASLCFSPSQKSLTISTGLGQLYTIDLVTCQSGKDQPQFVFLSHSFHCGAIIGLSTCIQKPLLATCSMDRTVRIWNFESRMLEFYKGFAEVPLSIALHPTGLSILVVFLTKLVWLNLLIDDFRTFKEFPLSGCTECAFSHGGHMFAVVCGTDIHVFSTITFENVLNLKDHKKKVQSIVWNEDDRKLVSLDMDGAVYEWNTISGKLESEIVHTSYMYTSVAVSPDGRTIFVVGTDFTLKEIHQTKILTEVLTGDIAYTTIALSRSGRVLFCGTTAGTVFAISCTSFQQKNFQYQGQGHTAPIAKMVVTFDDHFLLTVSEDGCLFIWKIVWERFGLKKDKELTYLEEIFITKSDLEDKNQLMQELRNQVKEIQIDNKFQLCFKDMEHEREVRKMTEKYTQEIDGLKTKYEVLTAEKERLELFHKETMETVVEKNNRELRILNADTYRKLTHEYEMSHALQLTSQKKLDEYESKLQRIEESHKKMLEDLTRCYESKLQENILKLTASEGVAQQQQQEYDVMKKMIEEDSDREILDIRCKYEHKLHEEQTIATEYRDETGIMRKKASHVQKEMNNKNTDIEKLKLELLKRQNIIDALKKDILGFKNEIKLRNSNIEEKEKSISDLRKQTTELDKSKFLMDYKIKELLNKVEPNEKIIEEMKEQIQEMEGELDRFKRENTKMKLIISELKVKLKVSDTDKRREMQRLSNFLSRMWSFKSDLHHCMEFIQDPKRLKEGILKLHSTYLEPSDVEFIQRLESDMQENVHKALCEREDIARNAINSLKGQLARENEAHQRGAKQKNQENAALIAEMNTLRYNLKILEDQLHKSQLELNTKQNLSEDEACTLASPITAPVRLHVKKEPERTSQKQSQETEAHAKTNQLRPPSRGEETKSTHQTEAVLPGPP